MVKNPCCHSKTSIQHKHHFVQETIEEDKINITDVKFEEQLAEILRKALLRTKLMAARHQEHIKREN